MTAESPAERTLRARSAAHARWSQEPNREAATKAARAGLQAKFEQQVDPDRLLDPIERAKRADSARKAYYAELSRLSAKKRRERKGQAA
jgi:hypothetical protein